MDVDDLPSTPINATPPPFPSPTKSRNHSHTPRSASRLKKNFGRLNRSTTPVSNPHEVRGNFETDEFEPEELHLLWRMKLPNYIPEAIKIRRRRKAFEDTPELLQKLDVLWNLK